MIHPPSVREKAIELYVAGATAMQVGEQLGISDGTVGTWVRAAGVARPKGSHAARADRSLRRPVLDDLYDSGDPLAVVARRHGISPTALYNWRTEDLGDDFSFKGEWVRDGLVWRPVRRAA